MYNIQLQLLFYLNVNEAYLEISWHTGWCYMQWNEINIINPMNIYCTLPINSNSNLFVLLQILNFTIKIVIRFSSFIFLFLQYVVHLHSNLPVVTHIRVNVTAANVTINKKTNTFLIKTYFRKGFDFYQLEQDFEWDPNRVRTIIERCVN